MITSLPDNYSPQRQIPIKPDITFVHVRLAHFIAMGAGIGLIRYMPGTAGTIAAFPFYRFLDSIIEPVSLLLIIDVFSSWASGHAQSPVEPSIHLIIPAWYGMKSSLSCWYCFHTGSLDLAARCFFPVPVFDIVKPAPIGYLDARLKGGLGVMLDDLLAAFYTLLCLAGWKSMVLFESYF